MLHRPSRELYHEELFNGFGKELGLSLERDGPFARELKLASKIYRKADCDFWLQAHIAVVPDCLTTHIAINGERLLYYVR